jgi:hypothetical protein
MPGSAPDLPQPGRTPLSERRRAVHLEMVDAVLSGQGLGRVAELAAGAAGAPVAIVMPGLAVAVSAPAGDGRLKALRGYVSDRLRDVPARVPDGVAAEVAISSGDEPLGAVLLLDHPDPAGSGAFEFLHLAGVASLTEVALAEAREQQLRSHADGGDGAYRLLSRALASDPEEVRSLYERTVAPIVRYDDLYATDLVGTLESYLGHDCQAGVTAASLHTHRHTVAYRLDRIRELTGLDPARSEDRERLSLGLKAYRVIAPTLPR